MGLDDIFGTGKPKSDVSTEKTDTSSNIASVFGEKPTAPQEIVDLAKETSAAYENAAAKAAIYQERRKELICEVDKRLEDLKEAAEAAEDTFTVSSTSLFKEMGKANVTEVDPGDRPPIHIKVTKGAKKSITKTWLTSKFGKEKAEGIWKSVPNKPDSRTLVIPKRFEDEPSY